MPRDFWRQIFANNIFVRSCRPVFFVKSNILLQENIKNPHATLQCFGLFEKLCKNVAWIRSIVNDFSNFNFNAVEHSSDEFSGFIPPQNRKPVASCSFSRSGFYLRYFLWTLFVTFFNWPFCHNMEAANLKYHQNSWHENFADFTALQKKSKAFIKVLVKAR